MAPVINSNESYCTFTLASDVTAGGLPSEAEIAKDLESNDDSVRIAAYFFTRLVSSRLGCSGPVMVIHSTAPYTDPLFFRLFFSFIVL
jgi:hypothetical protein